MSDLPTGAVTFLFTDIEGSTRLWAEHSEAMGKAVARHEELIRQEIDGHGGYVFFTAGDSFGAAFSTVHGAVDAAVQAQFATALEVWGETPIRVRMGIHSGEPEERDGNYFGPVVNEAARLMATAHGGQILASAETIGAAGGALPDGVECVDLGVLRLRDVDHPLTVVQLTHPDLDSVFPPLRGLAETPHNLPQQLTSFVGRDRELAEIGDLVADFRLVTLTGAGGSGKTRLAQQYAAEVLDEFPDGVWFVDLAVVDDSALVAGVMALTVGVAEAPGRSIVDRLVDRLEDRKTLLILDNCEHVLDEAASLVVDVMKRTEAVRVVATSRQPLGIAGEHLYLVPTLEAPVDLLTDPAILEGYAAVRLFRDRAEAVQPGFAVTGDNAAAIGQICQRLDGLPLALELASARLNILDPVDLQRRLDDRFTLLTAGSRDQVARHQTLAATLDWSYQLLTAEEQKLLNRLSVFVGGFDLDAVDQVCGWDGITPDRVLDLVAGLVDKSLLVTYQGLVGRRFRFLETVRDYAMARLLESDEQGEIARRHAEYFQQLAVTSYDRMWGSGEAEWLHRLEDEWPNLRQALQWHLDEQRIEDGQMLVGSLRGFLLRRYHGTEGVVWLRRFVAADPAPSPGRARALFALATVSSEVDEYLLWDEVIDLNREYASKGQLAGALNNAGFFALLRGERERARERISEAVQLQRDADDPQGLAVALSSAGDLAMYADSDPRRAVALYEESLAWARQSATPSIIALILTAFGRVRRLAGDLDGATAALDEARQLSAKLGSQNLSGLIEARLASVALDRGDTQSAVAHLLAYNDSAQPLINEDPDLWNITQKPLLQWARVATANGQYEVAVTLLAALDAFQGDTREMPPYQPEVERTKNQASQQLEPDRVDDARNRGRAMTSTEALNYALDTLATASA